ncbi:MAG: cysteine--tRNA ligase, partial [Gemmatimonadota bacterium]|nr:cysteine--tRNA ligase [Gemmatimonadota bacterium]
MALRLYNTLGRQVQEFRPGDGRTVRMYTCGPTVYDRAHVGNFRTFLWEDLLRRTLRWMGWRVEQVMNITDVDDRTIRAAVERGEPLADVTRPVEEAFFADWDLLGLERVEHTPRATEHVPAMIGLVERLEAKELTYRRGGSVYFAIGRFPGYGRLIDLDPESLRRSGRVEGDEEYSKDDPRDFVLWKGGDREEEEGGVAIWDSPWGRGRPGWHLECSAMAMEFLGETLDIHTGGVDNIFPHHVNEMAQSEAATGRPFARFWLHAAHLLVDGAKMSKSLGNFHTVRSLVDAGHRPSSIRYLLLSGHHRQQLNFTLEGLEAAARAVARLHAFHDRLARAAAEDAGDADDTDAGDANEGGGAGAEAAVRWRTVFTAALEDDLNVADALGATFDLVREGNAALDASGEATRVARPLQEALQEFDRVFGVLALRAREESGPDAELAAWVEERLAARTAARAARDFARAD